MTLASCNVPLNTRAYTCTHTTSVKQKRIKKKKVVQAMFSQRGTSLRASFLLVWLWMVDALLGLRGATRSQGRDGLSGTGRIADGADTGARRFAGEGHQLLAGVQA